MDECIRQNGKALDKSKYTIDLDTKTFATEEDDLFLDFTGLSDWTFKTGGFSTFKGGHKCIFNTGSICTFNTGYGCTFGAGGDCTFYTGYDCIFNTFNGCTFKTGEHCTFDTGDDCTFLLYDINTCKFKSGSSGIILDKEDNKHYLLNEEFIRLQAVING